jgi:hypothetical protein
MWGGFMDRYDRERMIEKVQTWIVWHLPKWMIYWAVVRAGAHATTGKYGNEHPDTVSIFDIMQRWGQSNEA